MTLDGAHPGAAPSHHALPAFLFPLLALSVSFRCLGILPFAACFIELFFIMSSVWLGQTYYVFGFLLLVTTLMLLMCAEGAIVLTYFSLCAEDYRWWWRSFLGPATVGLYVLAYSVFYFQVCPPQKSALRLSFRVAAAFD